MAEIRIRISIELILRQYTVGHLRRCIGTISPEGSVGGNLMVSHTGECPTHKFEVEYPSHPICVYPLSEDLDHPPGSSTRKLKDTMMYLNGTCLCSLRFE